VAQALNFVRKARHRGRQELVENLINDHLFGSA
jgi:hypothetical protein